MNPIELLVGAVAGQLVTAGVWATQRYLQHRVARSQARALNVMRNTAANSQWLEDYYKRTGQSESLYNCRIGDFERKIPFMTMPDWCFFHDEDLKTGAKSRFDLVKGSETFSIDEKGIKKREKLGQRIWPDSPSVYLDRVEFQSEHQPPLFVLKRCTYHQVLSNIIRLEDETFDGVRSARFEKAHFRASVLPSASKAVQLVKKPFGLGGAVLIVLKSKRDCKVLIHERSGDIATYPSAKAVVPNFGFEPIAEIGAEVKEDIFRFNLFREFAEELFNYEELVRAATGRRIDPLWFYDVSKEVKHLRAAIKDSLCSIASLGFGFDCLNGVPIFSYVVVVESEKVINDIEHGTNLNWEGAGVQIISLNRSVEVLRNWLCKGEFHPGGAFTLARGLQYLQSKGIWQPS
jgi:hypothetical protein